MSQKIHVVGQGPCFEQRYLQALERAGFRFVDSQAAADIVVFSRLDRSRLRPSSSLPPVLILANDDDEDVGQDSRFPMLISSRVSPERLVSELNSILLEARGRRQTPRLTAPIGIRFTAFPNNDDPIEVAGELLNLGLGGAFVRTLRALPEGCGVDLDIQSGDQDDVLRLSGKVVHSICADLDRGIVSATADTTEPIPAHPGFAMAFGELSEATIQRLQHFLASLETADTAPV